LVAAGAMTQASANAMTAVASRRRGEGPAATGAIGSCGCCGTRVGERGVRPIWSGMGDGFRVLGGVAVAGGVGEVGRIPSSY
jgi:hypothetical protein